MKEKGQKCPAVAPSGDMAGACKVGKSEKETAADAGSSLWKLGKLKEIQGWSSIHACLQNLKLQVPIYRARSYE